MSEEIQAECSPMEVECQLCGLNGQPPSYCDVCHGGAPTQERAYTLSDHRTGRAPQEDRYGNDGGLNPKASPLVVGGQVNHPSHRQS